MDKIVVKIKVTNLKDFFLQQAGSRKEAPRQAEIDASPEEVPKLLGQVRLEVLDLAVDSRNQRLVSNPGEIFGLGTQWNDSHN